MPDDFIAQDETLYLVTLPSGNVCYTSEAYCALFNLHEHVKTGGPWQTLFPETIHEALESALQQVLETAADVSVDVSFAVDHEWRFDHLILRPMKDGDTLVSVGWHGQRHSAFKSHFYDMFHLSAIAQWVINPAHMYRYLLECEIDNPLDLEERAKQDKNFVEGLRDRLQVVDANDAAAELYDVDSFDRFKEGVLDKATEEEILNTGYAVLSIGSRPTRHNYQMTVTTEEGAEKRLWISCEIPSLSELEKGFFVSAVDITSVKETEQELEEREQFLGAILKTIPDILMVYDFARGETIFQNADITEHLGYSAQDNEDAGNQLINYIIHPDDAVNRETFDEIVSTLKQGGIYERTLRLQHNNGEWHHYYFRSAALDKDELGRVINAVVVARDITEVLKAEQILTEQQKHYQLLAANYTDIVITTDTLFRVNYVSPSLETVLGYAPDEFLQWRDALLYLGVDQHAAYLASELANTVLRVDDETHDFSKVLESEAMKADGSRLPVELQVSIVRDEHHLLEGMLIVIRDITDRIKAEANQRLAAKVFENSIEGIYITDENGVIVQTNKAFQSITGYGDVIGKKPSELGSGWQDKSFKKDIRPALDKKGVWSGELMSRRSNGEAFLIWMNISEVKDARDNIVGTITSFRDITEAKSSENRIRKMAYYDVLTELPNRQLLHDRLSQALRRGMRNRKYVGLLFLDLDGFKPVNDQLGHAVGDKLLKEVAARLKKSVRTDDTVARMGGDEFTVILHGLRDRLSAETAAANISAKIIEAINEPFLLDDKEAKIGTSIGISLFPDDAQNESDLIKLADAAMYDAKQKGKNNYQFYTEEMHNRAAERQKIERGLRHAMDDDEFVLAFQPKLIAGSQHLYGFEALLRWDHPEKGLIAPNLFMPSLDDLGMGSSIGEWVIEKACMQLSEWLAKGMSSCSVSVNAFSKQYREGDLLEAVQKALLKTGIQPDLLTIEVSEDLVMSDPGYSYGLLTKLKDLGVRIGLDDYGSGQLSPASLNRLPIDELKIDRELVARIDENEEVRRLVAGLVSLGISLRKDVIALGVERASQLEVLKAMNCPKVQGFMFCKPIHKEELASYLDEHADKQSSLISANKATMDQEAS